MRHSWDSSWHEICRGLNYWNYWENSKKIWESWHGNCKGLMEGESRRNYGRIKNIG